MLLYTRSNSYCDVDDQIRQLLGMMLMIFLQMASTIALHLLSQLDARHGHHPVQGLQQGATDDDHDDDAD